MAQPITLAEIKAAKTGPTIVEVDSVGPIEVNVLGFDDYWEYMQWASTMGADDENLAEKFARLIKMCCPVFGQEDPQDCLNVGPLLQLGHECARINGLTREEPTAKN